MIQKTCRLLWPLVCLCACTYTIKIKDGVTAVERKQYAYAIPLLEKEYTRAKTRVERGKKAYLLGECLRNTGRYAEAIKWYGVAHENSFGPDALRSKAYMLKQTEQYAEAQVAFKQLGQEIGSQYEYRKEITACTIAEGWKKTQDSTEWQLSQALANTTASEFSPLPDPQGRMTFTSDRTIGGNKKTYAWTGKPFYDIYVVTPEGASAQIFDAALNSPAHESHLCFSADGNEIWFNRSVPAGEGADHYMQIFTARRKEEGWSVAEPMPFQRERINYLHPAISPDGKALLFSTTDGLYGGYDLCISYRGKDGWSEPKPLPRVLNTAGNEVFPVWHADTVYFSSTEHTGMGGLDIFKTWRIDAKTWAPPINLKAPINSGFDDFGFWVRSMASPTPTEPGATIAEGFFSSNRPGGKGADDIYQWQQKVPKKPELPKTEEPPAKKLSDIVLEVVVLEKIFSEPDNPNSRVIGRKPIQGAQLEVKQNGKVVGTEILKEGMLTKTVLPDLNFEFRANAEGFLAGTATTSTVGFARVADEQQRLDVEIVLDRVYKNREITLENIYYDYDRAEIRPDAEPTLNKLVNMLNQNPGIRIQLGSHTDCRGNERYNQELSQRRAQSAVNYLISKGIDPNRLAALGYGETVPIANCGCSNCSEFEHQMNRRTTFKILE